MLREADCRGESREKLILKPFLFPLLYSGQTLYQGGVRGQSASK